MDYEFLEHTADIKFRARGKTLADAFENAVAAFSSYIGKGEKIHAKKKKKIVVEGNDYENLFYHFLDELIYLMDAEHFVVSSAKVRADGMKIEAELSGDDYKNYKDLDHVKAATYAEMYVKKVAKGWEVQAVLDV